MEVEEKVMNEEKLKMYLTILNDENPSHVKENAKTNIIILFEKQQKEIESLYKIRNIIFEFIPKTIHEVELKTKIVKSLGE